MCNYLENSIIEIFNQKLQENPYLEEIKHYFVVNTDENALVANQANLHNQSIEISPIRVSTMVVLCDVGLDVNLDIFYQNIQPYENLEKGYKIISLEYMENPAKGTPKQKKKKQCQANARLVKRRKSFYNQATVIMDYIKPINLKLFRNGSIHITGVVDEVQAQKAVGFLCDEIRVIHEKDNAITTADISGLGCRNWNIVMINSDFSCNFKIRREKLYEILDSRYGLVVNYESDNYPGVKTSFYWSERDPMRSGVCKCKVGKTCSGKGTGTLEQDDTCRKITISIFQSGKIIITGARNLQQIDDAYQFISKILRLYYDNIAREL